MNNLVPNNVMGFKNSEMKMCMYKSFCNWKVVSMKIHHQVVLSAEIIREKRDAEAEKNLF